MKKPAGLGVDRRVKIVSMGKFITIFQFYSGDIKNSTPKGSLSLGTFIERIRHPKNPEIFDRINEAKEKGDAGLVAFLKQSLPCFTPPVLVNRYRRLANIQRFTGLFSLDFDGLTTTEAVTFRDFVFTEYKCLWAAWLSASRHGVRAFVNIGECNSVDEFRQYYFAIEAEFRQYPGFDVRMKNPVQPLFFSHDPGILFRDNPDTWTAKAAPPPPPPPANWEPAATDDKTVQTLRKIAMAGLKTIYRKISDDGPGHPSVIALSRLAGGYVGAGLFDRYDMQRLISNWIDEHNYLSKKKSTYKKTAEYFISEGEKAPIKPTIR